MRLDRKKYLSLLTVSGMFLMLLGCNEGGSSIVVGHGGGDDAVVKATSQQLFTCKKDGSDSCGCLIENDGSGLMWYRTALIQGPETYGTYYFSDKDAAVKKFNSQSGHCGSTSWRIPTLKTTDNLPHNFGDPQIESSTDFGRLGNYAIANGYNSNASLGTWLRNVNGNQGFILPNAGEGGICDEAGACLYWSSSIERKVSKSQIYVWQVDTSSGSVLDNLESAPSSAYLLLVSGGD